MFPGKRKTYENETSSSGEDTSEETVHNQNDENKMAEMISKSRPKRKPTCFSKNALMARENRLRKKMYVSNLEDSVTSLRRDNKRLSLIVDNQSSLIAKLKKEVKYLKSVIANSSDISRLMRNIHQSSGMSVSSSLDENLSLKNSCIPKPKQLDNQNSDEWMQMKPIDIIRNGSTEQPSNSGGDNLNEELFNDFELPLDLPDQDLLNDVFLVPEADNTMLNNDHNYTMSNETNDHIDDVGVCLHVSKHHVSLEFCPTCNEKALQNWDYLLKLCWQKEMQAINSLFNNFKSLIWSVTGFSDNWISIVKKNVSFLF